MLIKNAVMLLHELFPPPKTPQYKVTSKTGPPNNPTFTMVCTVGNKSFWGEGRSKKKAKLSCSQKALDVLDPGPHVLHDMSFEGSYKTVDGVMSFVKKEAKVEKDDTFLIDTKRDIKKLDELAGQYSDNSEPAKRDFKPKMTGLGRSR